MVLLLAELAVVLLVDALVRSAWMLVAVAGSNHAASALLTSLLGVSAILPRPHSRVWTDNLPLHAKQRLIYLDKLVY